MDGACLDAHGIAEAQALQVALRRVAIQVAESPLLLEQMLSVREQFAVQTF